MGVYGLISVQGEKNDDVPHSSIQDTNLLPLPALPLSPEMKAGGGTENEREGGRWGRGM